MSFRFSNEAPSDAYTSILENYWLYYVDTWSSTPTYLQTIPAGDIYVYILKGVTRYRLVPVPYNPINDCFYGTLLGSTLSNKIACKGC